MARTIGYTSDEVRELVREYVYLPHGMKAKWLAGQPLSGDQMNRWRMMCVAGALSLSCSLWQWSQCEPQGYL